MQVRRRVWCGAAVSAVLLGAVTVPAVGAGPVTAVVTPPTASAAAEDDGVPYPRQEPLTEPPVNEEDQSYWRGAIPFHEIAPLLNGLTETSEYVSTEVVGQSTEERDLYLVTITAPETAAESAQQDAWRDRIKHDADAAQDDAALMAGYKTPIWFNNNIHGNEWDGTDATLAYITELVGALEAGDEEALALAEGYRLYFTVTNNPDGRVAGTRATALNLDANRDFITNTTPETRAVRDLTGDLQPVFFIDLHGYTGTLQVEPTGPPQGENYEHDLLMPYSYAAALRIEQDVVAADIEGNPLTEDGGIIIPFRDIPSGWDGWPPIFTPQYVQFQGSIAYTVELGPGRSRAATVEEQLVENAQRLVTNREVGRQVIESTVAYVDENRDAILGNQMEIFRRGQEGEPLREIPANPDPDDYAGPDEWTEEWDEPDVTGTDFPRAYLIPAGTTDAATLVDHLLAHGVEVGTADAAFGAAGEEYPSGTFVVDMHQPLRGLANVLLSDGSDISDRVPSMYDISAWSLGRLWGAEVDRVGDTTDPALPVTATPLVVAPPTGSFPADAGYVSLALDGVAAVQAVNLLLAAGVAVADVGDGTVVVGPDGLEEAEVVSELLGVAFTASDGSELAGDDVRGLSALRVGYTSSAAYGGEDELVLTGLGFVDPVRVTPAGLADGTVDLDEIDVLWLGAPLRLGTDDAAARAALELDEYFESGRGVVASAQAGTWAADTFGLFEATAVSGPGRANGVVLVDTADGVIGAQAEGAAFTYGPAYFTDLGEEVTVEQTFTAEPLLSGHWLPNEDGTGGPEQAAGQPSVISAVTDDGSRALVFGTDPLFRTHPRGMFDDVAAALYWAGPEGALVEPPVEEPTEEPTTPEPTEEPTTSEPTEEPTTAPTSEEPTVVPTAGPTNGPGSGRLPSTGADVWALGVLTVLLAGGGGVLVARRRGTD
ncbi:LPXTG cell wall anchor domain-containing protein [Georgenia satyanarayanai]|uniref:M14 family zinc carboxypeptidase n=1 Tax=Georgenia satyanarayanai TaxID=860221 RepID=UPI00203CF065|nr:M14 family zinc carboxypeptidase [Georgenia satyanarayanai]MCM3661661.1 LPXTG cell wall anchor domain-containing protein [Georgenia satyanarayanai]